MNILDLLNGIIYIVGCGTITAGGMTLAVWLASYIVGPQPSTTRRVLDDRPYAGETDSELERDLMQTTDELNTVIGISVGLDEPSDATDRALDYLMCQRRQITREEMIRWEARAKR